MATILKIVTVAALVLLLPAGPARAACEPHACRDHEPYNALVGWVETPYIGDFTTAVRGDVIWVSSNRYLYSYDASDPREPRLIQTLMLPDTRLAEYTTIAGDLAFTTGQYGLVVTDISDAAHPVVLSMTPRIELHRSVYRDGFIYAAGGFSVVAIDVRDPARPAVTSTQSTGVVVQLALHGDELVVLDQYGKLRGFDIGDPASLVPAWQVPVSGSSVRSLVVIGDSAYVADSGRMLVYRLAGGTVPALVATLPAGERTRLFAAGDTLYQQDELGIHVMDAAEPTAPRELNLVRGPQWSSHVSRLGELFVVAYPYGRLGIVDPRVPADPEPAATFRAVRQFIGVGMRGEVAFATYNRIDERPGSGVMAVDFSRPGAPQVVGEFRALPTPYGDVAIRDHYLFTNHLYCLDISDPAHMRAVNTIRIGDRFALRGNLAFTNIESSDSRIQALDVTDPAHPRMLATFETGCSAERIAAAGDLVFVGGWSDVVVVDAAVPSRMRVLSRLRLDSRNCSGLAVQGDLVYHLRDDQDLTIIDVSDPALPFVRSTLRLPVRGRWTGQSMAVGNGVLYLGRTPFGTLMVDIADADAPRVTGYVGLQHSHMCDQVFVDLSGDRLVTATDNGWLQVSTRQCGDVMPVEVVSIDVGPGDRCPRVPCGPRARGRISVAVLTTKDFDAGAIDPSTLRFGPEGAPEVHFATKDQPGAPAGDGLLPGLGGRGRRGGRDGRGGDGGHDRDHDHDGPRGHFRDVDCDGDVDFVGHFDAAVAAFACGDSVAELTGLTTSGVGLCGGSAIETGRGCRDAGAPGDAAQAGAKSLRDDGDCGGEGHPADKDAVAAGAFRQAPALAPNPFNPETLVTFELAVASRVSVDVHDLAGRRVARLADGDFEAGAHALPWRGGDDNGRPLPSGVYFVRVAGPGASFTLRAALVK